MGLPVAAGVAIFKYRLYDIDVIIGRTLVYGSLAAFITAVYVAIAVAVDHGHYLSIPFLGLFLCGFGYVGWVSLWQGSVGLALRAGVARLLPRRRCRHSSWRAG